MIQRFLATKSESSLLTTVYSVVDMIGVEQGNINNDEFMEEVVR